MSNDKPYSYHTFIYPFRYGEYNDFLSKGIIENCTLWQKPVFDEYNNGETSLYYNSFQYFLPKARRIIFPKADDKINDYIYNANGIRIILYRKKEENNSQFAIDNKSEEIYLNVKQIRLKILTQYRIGIITIESENNERTNIEDINWINDKGRRAFAPSLDSKLQPLSSLLPQKIKIIGIDNGNSTITVDYTKKHIINKIEGQPDLEGRPTIIEQLVYEKNYNNLISNKKDNYKLEPVLDDRMFVATLYDGDVPPLLSNDLDNEKLYKFFYLEYGDCTCQDTSMLKEKLKNTTYTRWKNYGTIYGITEYSLACIANAPPEYVTNAFLTEYVYMVELSLIQRAVMTELENKTKSVIRDIGKNKKNINKIEPIWQEYVKFQSEIYIPEVCFQEQGIEMYDMIKNSLRLEQLYNYLYSNMENLRVLSEMNSNDHTNVALNLMTVVGTSVAIFALGQDYISAHISDNATDFDKLDFSFICPAIITVIFIVLSNVFSYLIMTRIQKKSAKFILLTIIWLLIILLLRFSYCFLFK